MRLPRAQNLMGKLGRPAWPDGHCGPRSGGLIGFASTGAGEVFKWPLGQSGLFGAHPFYPSPRRLHGPCNDLRVSNSLSTSIENGGRPTIRDAVPGDEGRYLAFKSVG